MMRGRDTFAFSAKPSNAAKSAKPVTAASSSKPSKAAVPAKSSRAAEPEQDRTASEARYVLHCRLPYAAQLILIPCCLATDMFSTAATVQALQSEG